jgi:hypothetical protein
MMLTKDAGTSDVQLTLTGRAFQVSHPEKEKNRKEIRSGASHEFA